MKEGFTDSASSSAPLRLCVRSSGGEFSRFPGRQHLIFVLCSLLIALLLSCGDDPTETNNKIAIVFNTGEGGSEVASIKIDEGAALPTDYFGTGSKVPTRTGYTFNGWKNGETDVTAATTFSQDTTLTAQWTPTGQQQQVTVTFSLGEGVSGTPPASVTINNGTALGNTRYPANPTRPGYDFDGWYNGTTRYTSTTVINAAGATFVLTARWEEEYVVEYAQSPAIHPGNHFMEIGIPNGIISNAQVNVDFSANGLMSNVERGAGILTSQWYRTTKEGGEGEEIEYRQSAAGTSTPHDLSLGFTWRESEPGTYWYWVVVTNTNENATVQQTSSSVTQNRLKVIVTTE
jgi:uncharacterized repeat protein (TIGR02543 family)